MSDWANYYKERFGHETIEEEWGFLCFSFAPPFVALQDVYVKPEFRRTKSAHSAMKIAGKMGKARDCTQFWTQVWANDLGASRSLQTALSLDFRVLSAEGNRIILTKEIGE